MHCLFSEVLDRVVATGTHGQMWIALRQLSADEQQNYFVAPLLEYPIQIGGTRNTPKGIRASGMFPGVKKCISRCTKKADRQHTRLELRQYIMAL